MIDKEINMNAALNLNWSETTKTQTIPEEARGHIEVLTELLRDVNLEQRMETLIKAECFLKQEDVEENLLQEIRQELETELMKLRKMIFMVEQAQYFIEAKKGF